MLGIALGTRMTVVHNHVCVSDWSTSCTPRAGSSWEHPNPGSLSSVGRICKAMFPCTSCGMVHQGISHRELRDTMYNPGH
jgi:hypothetical protein